MRTLTKFARDMIVTNTLGQALVAILNAIPLLTPYISIPPEKVAVATSILMAALAIWRVLREQVGILMKIDPPGAPPA